MATAKPARTFQDLLVWQKAHRFVLEVYAFTASFPKHETYGLSLQMPRAAVSIPANIAEGLRRRSKPDKARYTNCISLPPLVLEKSPARALRPFSSTPLRAPKGVRSIHKLLIIRQI
jgi:hypothetical protein